MVGRLEEERLFQAVGKPSVKTQGPRLQSIQDSGISSQMRSEKDAGVGEGQKMNLEKEAGSDLKGS